MKLFLALATTALFLFGCSGKTTTESSSEEPASSTSSPDTATQAKAATNQVDVNGAILEAQIALTKGAVDDAAAKLLDAQLRQAQFDQKSAADYRETLAEAYSKALELAAKGDPRGKAALELIRATNPR